MKIHKVLLILTLLSTGLFAQSPIRVGTTTAEFLGIGYGPAASALGDAYVSMAQDVSSIYWNPAGLSFMEKSQVMFTYQPWIVDISTYFSGAAIVLPRIGTLGFGFIGANYGDMEVTTVDMQQGTGEIFNAGDYAVSLSYGRKLAQWFGFGASAKYIRSTIWHTSASAFAVDLGVLIQTPFFSTTGENEHGLRIGMGLSNYGSRMAYSGVDLLGSVDIAPDESGNYKDVKVYYATDGWELPLIFRVGMSLSPVVTTTQQLTVAIDALHVNNNSESVNVGMEYRVTTPGIGKVFLRGGYRALFLDDSEFGPTFGIGVLREFFGNRGVQFDYAYRDIGVLGYVNTFSVGVLF